MCGERRIEVAEWISVKDKSPTKKGQYLVAYHVAHWDSVNYEYTVVGIDSFRGGKADNRYSWAHNKYRLVTHWMPLPEPPKEENDD